MKLFNKITTAMVLSALMLSACGEINEKKTEQDTSMETAENMEVEVPNTFEAEETRTISGLTSSDERFDSLNIALEKANLHSSLNEDTTYTVLAPTDAAFDSLPEGKLDSLFEQGNENELTRILSYHVISGKYSVSDIKQGIEAHSGSYTLETLEGGRLTFTLDNSEIVITGVDGGEARIVAADVEATNGVIHGIDHVVMFK